MPKLGLDDKLQQIAADIAGDAGMIIHPDIFDHTNKTLQKAISQVYGDVDADDFINKLKGNITRFSAYKSAWETEHIRNSAAELLPAINGSYNVNWLRTEYEHAVRSTRAAKNWQQYESDKDLYPYLEYIPSTAAEPRSDHQRLYGVIKKLDDPFWDTWMPPSDWGCRCSVEQVRSDSGATEPPEDLKLPPATMRNNTGKDGTIFTDKHPMISKVGKPVRDKIEEFITQQTKVDEP